MNTNPIKRAVSLLLSFTLLAGNLPVAVFAAEDDTLCDHHTVHTGCSYEESGICGYECTLCAEVPESTAAPAETEPALQTDAATQPAETVAPEDQAAADAVSALIHALPSLDAIRIGSPEEQQAAYTQVQEAYDAYEALTDAQKALLPSAGAVFGPYFDYFNSQTQTAATIASGEQNSGRIAWVLDDAGTLTITGTGSLNIWGSKDSPWYDYRDMVKKVIIGSGVDEIRPYQFYECTNMTSISIPETVTEISWSAFYNCSSLTSITLPSGITEIHSRTFEGCKSLTKIVIPSGVTRIGDNAFYGCDSLTSVSIPNTVTTIEGYAFSSCDKLASITIPSSVTELASHTFYYCSALSSVSLPSTLTAIGERVFNQCTSLKTISLPAGLKSIGYHAFGECTALSSITLPSGLQTLGSDVFDKCTSLTSVTIPKNVTSIEGNPFRFCSNLKSVQVASGNTAYRLDASGALYSYDYSQLVYWPISKTGSYTVNARTTTILWGALADNQLTNIYLPDGLTTIGGTAFYNSVNLEAIEIPDSVTSMGQSAFYGCTKLKSIVIPESVTELAQWLFTGCTSLASVTLPASLTLIDLVALYGIADNADIYFGGTEEAWTALDVMMSGEYRLHPNCVGAEGHWYEKTVPVTCTAAGYTCDACPCGYEINIVQTGSATGAHDWQEATCQAPKTCSICGATEGEAVSHSFENNKCRFCGIPGGTCGEGLSWILDDSGTLTITGTGSMEDCEPGSFPWSSVLEEIREVIIEDGVTDLAPHAFSGCGNLEYVTIPGSVTDIGQGAFDDCGSLTDIYFGCTQEEWEAMNPPLPDTVFIHHVCTGPAAVWSPITVDMTCESDGYTCERCACGHERNKVITQPAPGHDWSDWTITGQATCTEDGARERSCGRCGKTETDVIEATGHTYEAVITPHSCTEDGFTTYTCHCGHSYTDDYVTAPGHSEVTDEAVAPGCSSTGLTEGSHCEVCGEVLTAQTEIPALGHSFEQQGSRICCSRCGEELVLRIHQDYILLDQAANPAVQLALEVSPAEFAEVIRWHTEGEEGIVTVDQSGMVTALAEGTAYVVAELSADDFKIAARCRIDVARDISSNDPTGGMAGIRLGTPKLTTELYSTAYAAFDLLLELPQNNSFQSANAEQLPESHSVAIDSVRFADEDPEDDFDLNSLFTLTALDDRRIAVVPTQYAVDNPGKVAKSYKARIIATVQGQDCTSGSALTLTVKKTQPKLKASIAAFNSFYSGDAREIKITGATPTQIRENSAKNTGKTTALPKWLTLEDGVLTLTKDAPLKTTSARAYLLVDTEEWRIPATVTLTVKNVYKAPALKLSASAVTVSTIAENSVGVSLKLLCGNKTETLEQLHVTSISAPNGYIVEGFDPAGGSFTLDAVNGFMSGTLVLQVHFSNTDVILPLKLKVRTAAVTLKPSVKTLTLNAAKDSALITVSASPSDYRISGQTVRLTTAKGVNKLDSGELEIRNENGRIEISTTSLTPEKATYKLYIAAHGTKEAVVTINVVSKTPSVTFRATGSMDLSFPDRTAVITPALKNCSGSIASFDYTAAELKGATIVNADIAHAFQVEQDGAVFRIRCVDEDAVNTACTYVFKLKLMLSTGGSVENTVNLKVKRTPVKLKLSATSLQLNKLIGDRGTVRVSCTTKGYAFQAPICQVLDSAETDATSQLDISYANSLLTVAVNDATRYGTNYKILLRANDHAPASVLTVKIPTEEKSRITASLKTSGKLDVIRDGSTVTVTPVYKNCVTTAESAEQLFIYSSEDNYAEPVNHLFSIRPNGKGGYAITKAEGAALKHGPTYKVQLVTMFGSLKVTSPQTKITVTMGSARLTAKASDATLFARDKHDRVLVWFEAKDAALNEVADIRIRNTAYRDLFEVIDYGNGIFAIGYRDNTVSSKLISSSASKTITLTLEVFLEGNQTAKVNTTARLKLTIVK